ncbi:type II toxin-antitoxin system RelE/ParE family toxin [Methylocystis sp. SC2]|uniref:type II toxin-antitoxin system RelE/ParE family toxin n=1 Tax=Methylocystis sp. (strain SC2) TaxID=187303 RepID=UPI00027AEBBA|nr:probable Plasmid stabilisation system [Methylocystis sp. SC2]
MTDAAEADLAEIWAYVAADSESAAARLLDNIKATCARLLDFPSSGVSREQLARGLRVVLQGNYAIYRKTGASAIAQMDRIKSAQNQN